MEDLFESYDLEGLTEEDDLLGYVGEIKQLKQEYRRIHAVLKAGDSENFATNYPYYDAEMKRLTDEFKEANKKVFAVKKADRKVDVDNPLVTREKTQVLSKRRYFMEQVNAEIASSDLEKLTQFERIRMHVDHFQSRLDKFIEMCSDLDAVFGLEDHGLHEENSKLRESIRNLIESGREKLNEIDAANRSFADDRAAEADAEKKLKSESLLACAKDLKHEIDIRHDSLVKKLSVDFSKLSDFEILDLKKQVSNLHTELRELIDKVSGFKKFVVQCENSAADLSKDATTKCDACNAALGKYLEKLAETISSRDISEKKLAASAGLKIECKKFSGHDCPTDIYTFRADFKKFVEPFVQKSLWGDYLKKNLLLGSALNLVTKIDGVDEIWKKLTEVYGDAALMLQKKLLSLEKLPNMENIKDDAKLLGCLTTLLNTITELSNLAKDFSLENELYYGVGLQKILDLIGTKGRRKFVKSIALEKSLDGKGKWNKLVEFLKADLKVREALVLDERISKSTGSDGRDKDKPKDNSRQKQNDNDKSGSNTKANSYTSNNPPAAATVACTLCGKDQDHVVSFRPDKTPYIEYIACKIFADKTPKERDNYLFKKHFCNKCLTPGVKFASKHNCDAKFVCPQKFMKNGVETECKKHVLVCGHHCKEKSNNDLLDAYKKSVLQTNGGFSDFSKNISISCFSESFTSEEPEGDSDDPDSIFSFQTVKLLSHLFNIFYDSGCGDLVSSKRAIDILESMGRAKLLRPGPLILEGVNNQVSICKHGRYEIRIPLANGTDAVMSGLCFDNVTSDFPVYTLTEVEKDFCAKIKALDKTLFDRLPQLPKEVGGKVDIMIGKHYLKYFPKEIARLDSGLTLYESMFESVDRTKGVIAGPHPEFTKVHRSSNFSNELSYYTSDVKAYVDYVRAVMSVPSFGVQNTYQNFEVSDSLKVHHCVPVNAASPIAASNVNGCAFGDPRAGMGLHGKNSDVYVSRGGPKCLKIFEKIENSGTEISYRCMDCRNCQKCLKDGLIEEISIQKEMEQGLINKNVSLDLVSGCASTGMPFLANPDTRLVTNDRIARKVFDSQVKNLSKSEKDRLDTLASEQKLQDLGYVDWLHNIAEEDRNSILNSLVRYFIPWRVVWSKSLSTPIRTVFDASSKTISGYSLNDLLPEGVNTMNNLIQIILRWSICVFGYHTDVRKMYNSIRMNKEFWRFQLYWWSSTLKPGDEPLIKVIKTAIYGVKCSGNQAERALRMLAEMMAEEYPMAYETIMNDLYVDDCISGEETSEARAKATDELKACLDKINFTLKGFVFSGEDPDGSLSEDGVSLLVGGIRWFPKGDFWKLNIGMINFARKVRGRKLTNENEIPEELCLRLCVSVTGEIFDPPGRTVPITAGLKLDISHIHKSGFTWDDVLPENIRAVWVKNFGLIQELGTLEYKRVIVPPNAKNLDIMTLDFGDASLQLICVAIYARFELKDGSYSCHLVFARSKIVPEDTSIPRAELIAASHNAATGFTVQKAFGKYHKRHMKFTDSTVAFHWLSCHKTGLKVGVRGHVVEVNRLTDREDWRHVPGNLNPADIGTRKGATIADVSEDSPWVNGLDWMSLPVSEFPVKTIDEINLTPEEMVEAAREKITLKTFHSQRNTSFDGKFDDQVKLRYKYSKYLVDPNKYRFRKVLRIMGLVLKFIKTAAKNVPKVAENPIFQHVSPNDLPAMYHNKLDKFIVTEKSTSQTGLVVEVSDQMLKWALNYFSVKTTAEVQHFIDARKYGNISKNIDGILYYSGRILPDQKLQGSPELCQSALDLCSTTFCVPVMDSYSPVAISIALEIHWYHPDVPHRGNETVHRQVLRVAHIIGGFSLVVMIKDGCRRCRILNRKAIEVAMGSIQDVNLCIAPAFYATQLDIVGPFKCYSVANKRATLKIWFLVFCCCTTGAINIRAMEDYSTDAFVLGFVRFSCQFGYPRYLLPDAGSQLIKGCQDMQYSYTDSKQILSVEYGVQYEPCPVGAHYVHGKVERKIQEVRKSVTIAVTNERLSIVQWETLMAQISNSINNLPIGLKNRRSNLENLDLLTPNRLILGRNNERCPNKPLILCPDHKRMLESNSNIFKAWFDAWLVSYVPTLVERPKWHSSNGVIQTGDVVLFLKAEKEFDMQYQYGIVSSVTPGADGQIRKVEVEYRNFNEGVTRKTQRTVRELVIIHPVDELDIYERLYELYDGSD